MIWITGGGTGGHLYPALNIAKELRRRQPGLQLHYIGAARGLEARVLPQTGIPYTLLPVVGNLRRGSAERISFYARLARSLWTCRRLHRRHAPTLVLGTGGYASYPAAQTAVWHRVPLYWQEQNAAPGEVTRRLGPKCRRIFVGFEESLRRLPGMPVEFTGNPVRPDIASGDRWAGRRRGGFEVEDRVLLVLGGSGGSRSINRVIARTADVLHRQGGLRIWWQTGRREFDHWRGEVQPELFPGTMCAYIDEIPDAYAACDLVLARAGAMTTSEICAVGKPAILVPFPHAAGRHQADNIDALTRAGAAIRVDDHELESGKLVETLLHLAADSTHQARLAAAARRLGRPDATQQIAAALESVL